MLGEVLTAVVTLIVVTVGAVRADIAAAAIHADQIVDVEDLAAILTGEIITVVAVVTDDSTEVVSMDVVLCEVLTAVVTLIVATVGAFRADIESAAIHADQIVDVEDLAAILTGEIITVVAVLADDAAVIRGVVVIGFDDTATVVTDADLVNVIDVHAHSSFLLYIRVPHGSG